MCKKQTEEPSLDFRIPVSFMLEPLDAVQSNILEQYVVKYITEQLKSNANWYGSVNDVYFCYDEIMESSTESTPSGEETFKDWFKKQKVNRMFSFINQCFEKYNLQNKCRKNKQS